MEDGEHGHGLGLTVKGERRLWVRCVLLLLVSIYLFIYWVKMTSMVWYGTGVVRVAEHGEERRGGRRE